MKEFKELSATVQLKNKPSTGNEAYSMLVQELKNEIKEKQEILTELYDTDTKEKFINDWCPATKSVRIEV